MVQIFSKIVMDALEITDTSPHNSLNCDCRDTQKVAFYIVNTHDQSVSCQLQISGDKGATWLDLGSPVVVAATTGIDWLQNADGYPFYRVEVTASSSPSAGDYTTITANQTK